MKIKGLLSVVLGAAVMLSAAGAAFAETAPTIDTVTETVDFSAPSVGLNVAEHSRDVIRQYINGHPFDMYRKTEYSKAPDGYMPFANFGKLSNTDLAEGRNALNVMRFIAGVGTQDVTLCPYATDYAQAAALACNYNGSLSHTVYYIQGMDMWTLRCAQTGAKNSNLASGFNNAAHSVVLGYMYDTNEKNIGELGHRRWCLNPPMYLTGFGQVGKYGAMYTTDKQLSQASNSGICWPAQNMPIEYFPADTAWSISMCETVPSDDIKVTLTRKSDMRVWTFSNEHADGYFSVNNDKSVPLDGCVIFRPDDIGGYSHGDVFNVRIEGLGKEVSYNVNFFDLDGDDSVFDVPEEAPETSEQPEIPEEPTSEPSDSESEKSGTLSDESKPALEFKCEETDIQITADPEVFPADTRFKAQPIESGCSATRFACDLSFICGGQTVQPNGSVRVSMPIPSGFANYRVLRVYHVENGRCSFVPSTVENGRVCFMANSFSPYIITSEELDGELIDFSDNEPTAPENSENNNEDSEVSENENKNGDLDSTVPESSANGGENPTADDNGDPEKGNVSSSAESNAPGGSENDLNGGAAPKGNPQTGAAAIIAPVALALCAAFVVITANNKKKG